MFGSKGDYDSAAAFGAPSGAQSATTFPEGLPANPQAEDGGARDTTKDDDKKDDDKKEESDDNKSDDGGDDKKDDKKDDDKKKDDTADESDNEDAVSTVTVNWTTQKIAVK